MYGIYGVIRFMIYFIFFNIYGFFIVRVFFYIVYLKVFRMLYGRGWIDFVGYFFDKGM